MDLNVNISLTPVGKTDPTEYNEIQVILYPCVRDDPQPGEYVYRRRGAAANAPSFNNDSTLLGNDTLRINRGATFGGIFGLQVRHYAVQGANQDYAGYVTWYHDFMYMTLGEPCEISVGNGAWTLLVTLDAVDASTHGWSKDDRAYFAETKSLVTKEALVHDRAIRKVLDKEKFNLCWGGYGRGFAEIAFPFAAPVYGIDFHPGAYFQQTQAPSRFGQHMDALRSAAEQADGVAAAVQESEGTQRLFEDAQCQAMEGMVRAAVEFEKHPSGRIYTQADFLAGSADNQYMRVAVLSRFLTMYAHSLPYMSDRTKSGGGLKDWVPDDRYGDMIMNQAGDCEDAVRVCALVWQWLMSMDARTLETYPLLAILHHTGQNYDFFAAQCTLRNQSDCAHMTAFLSRKPGVSAFALPSGIMVEGTSVIDHFFLNTMEARVVGPSHEYVAWSGGLLKANELWLSARPTPQQAVTNGQPTGGRADAESPLAFYGAFHYVFHIPVDTANDAEPVRGYIIRWKNGKIGAPVDYILCGDDDWRQRWHPIQEYASQAAREFLHYLSRKPALIMGGVESRALCLLDDEARGAENTRFLSPLDVSQPEASPVRFQGTVRANRLGLTGFNGGYTAPRTQYRQERQPEGSFIEAVSSSTPFASPWVGPDVRRQVLFQDEPGQPETGLPYLREPPNHGAESLLLGSGDDEWQTNDYTEKMREMRAEPERYHVQTCLVPCNQQRLTPFHTVNMGGKNYIARRMPLSRDGNYVIIVTFYSIYGRVREAATNARAAMAALPSHSVFACSSPNEFYAIQARHARDVGHAVFFDPSRCAVQQVNEYHAQAKAPVPPAQTIEKPEQPKAPVPPAQTVEERMQSVRAGLEQSRAASRARAAAVAEPTDTRTIEERMQSVRAGLEQSRAASRARAAAVAGRTDTRANEERASTAGRMGKAKKGDDSAATQEDKTQRLDATEQSHVREIMKHIIKRHAVSRQDSNAFWDYLRINREGGSEMSESAADKYFAKIINGTLVDDANSNFTFFLDTHDMLKSLLDADDADEELQQWEQLTHSRPSMHKQGGFFSRLKQEAESVAHGVEREAESVVHGVEREAESVGNKLMGHHHKKHADLSGGEEEEAEDKPKKHRKHTSSSSESSEYDEEEVEAGKMMKKKHRKHASSSSESSEEEQEEGAHHHKSVRERIERGAKAIEEFWMKRGKETVKVTEAELHKLYKGGRRAFDKAGVMIRKGEKFLEAKFDDWKKRASKLEKEAAADVHNIANHERQMQAQTVDALLPAVVNSSVPLTRGTRGSLRPMR